MKRLLSCLIALGALQLTSPALCAEKDKWATRIVSDKQTVQLDPAKAYVLVEAPGAIAVTLFQLPTTEERAKDRADHDAALAKDHASWEKKHPRWEKEMKTFKPDPGHPKPPNEPIEPTEENFVWVPLETRHMVTLGPFNRFSKSDEVSLFLQEVPPGEYAYYGNVNLGVGVCACMGTVKFDVAPGKITTLRNTFGLLDVQGKSLEANPAPPDGVDIDDVVARSAMIVGDATDKAHDPRLPADMFVAAQFQAMPTLPNWMGTEINRIQPIPGVIAYERGKVIDLKADQP